MEGGQTLSLSKLKSELLVFQANSLLKSNVHYLIALKLTNSFMKNNIHYQNLNKYYIINIEI